jgi:hypothetical protein
MPANATDGFTQARCRPSTRPTAPGSGEWMGRHGATSYFQELDCSVSTGGGFGSVHARESGRGKNGSWEQPLWAGGRAWRGPRDAAAMHGDG